MDNREGATVTNRDKIIGTAAELFHLYGYDGTSVDMLLKNAGVSKSNFYYYFESKEQLGLETLENLADYLLKLMSETMLNPDLNPLERLVSFYRNSVYFQPDIFLLPRYPGCFFGNMALEQSIVNEKFRAALEKFFQECEETVEECIRECVEQGFLYDHIDDPKAMSKLLVSQFEGAILMAKLKNSIAPLEEVYEEMKKLVVKKEWWYIADNNKIQSR